MSVCVLASLRWSSAYTDNVPKPIATSVNPATNGMAGFNRCHRVSGQWSLIQS
jgi:hypothetical protein